MNIVYKNPEIEYVRLGSLCNGDFFRLRGDTTLYMRVSKIESDNRILVFNTKVQLVDKIDADEEVEPFRNVDIVVKTYGG